MDADDVEFVLGSGLNSSKFAGQGPTTTLPESNIPNLRRRMVHMYLLDFNRWNRIYFRKETERQTEGSDTVLETKRNEALKRTVDSSFKNDPYFPRPLSSIKHEQSNWAVF